MSLATQLQRFAALAATDSLGLSRAQAWPVTVTLSTDTANPKTAVAGPGSPPAATRQRDELRGGYVERTTRTFCLLAADIPATATLRLGLELTVTADPLNPGTVGTVWRCFDLTGSNAGSEHRLVCFRLD